MPMASVPEDGPGWRHQSRPTAGVLLHPTLTHINSRPCFAVPLKYAKFDTGLDGEVLDVTGQLRASYSGKTLFIEIN